MTPTTVDPSDLPTFLILKIGGGLFSVKSRDHDIDHDAVAGYARQVADLAAAAPGRMVLVSGGGSYGHGAVRHLDPEDPWAALPLTGANAELRWIWTTALHRAGALAFPVQLAAAAVLEEGGAVVGVGSLQRLLATGALPVLTGDCLPHPDGSLRVVGSDHVPSALLGLSAGPVRVAMLTDVDGVLDDGRTIPWIDPRATGPAREALRVAPDWDTTGAMAGKLDAVLDCARRGAECLILRGDPDQPDLRHLLRPVSNWPAELRHTRIADSEPTTGQLVDTVPA
ncbi:hypothetical protein AB0I52_20685 [Streptomyces sp. NPDC050423]|uniref:amino acid kinase family protein n=1 Tax=Streptomyces sp. NPDC050423 TaxID=3155402 RepID=UPI00341E86E5